MPPDGQLHHSRAVAKRGREFQCRDRPQPRERTRTHHAEGLSESLWGKSSTSPTTESLEVGLCLSLSILRRTRSSAAAALRDFERHSSAAGPAGKTTLLD